MHLKGGCFQYSNQIIANMTGYKEVWIPNKVAEEGVLKGCNTLYFWGYPTCLRYLSLAFFLIRIYVYALIGQYSSLIVFGHTSWDYYVIKIWKLTGLPSFYVVHDGKMHDGEHVGKTQHQLVQIMNMATHLIFLSNYVRMLVKKNFNINKPYIIAPHGLIDYGQLPKAEKTSKKPNLLFLGRVSKYKGVELLLAAMEHVQVSKYNKLIIAGKWSYPLPQNYDKDKIEIVDKWLSSDEILYYLSMADIMLFPYLEATQSGVATLAINYLKPSIVTTVGALVEQFNDASVIYVPPKTEDLTNAISSILDNECRLQSMRSSLNELKTKYSWKCIGADLENQIDALLVNKYD